MTQNAKEQDYESELADHGVRKYDYDIGRFTCTDVLFEKYYGWSPYQYSANNPINMLDWNGKYYISEEQSKKYRRLNLYLKTGIQELANNPKILNNLKKYGEFTDEQINKVFKYGSGPEIFITKLNGVYGEFTPNIGSNELRINEKYVNQFEKATGYEREALLFLLAVTILHETVHYGDDQDGKDIPGEEGNQFEEATYGRIITIGNAEEIIKGYIKRKKSEEKVQESSTNEVQDDEKK